MPKILVFTSLFPNRVKPDLGIFIQKRMTAYARRKGCSIEVVAPVPYCPDLQLLRRFQHYSQVPLVENIGSINVYHPRYFMIPKISMNFHGRLIYLGIRNYIKNLYKKFSFDMIDAHFIYPDCQAAVFLGEMLDVPVVVSARGSDINQYIHYPSIKPQITETLRRASHVISVCKALKKMMLDLGVQNEKISVIPNGIDESLFFMLDKKKSKKKLGIDTSDSMVLSVGALIPRKGHDITIHAVEKLVKINPAIRLFIIGSGPEESRLRALVNELNLNPFVVFVGQIPNESLITWYNAADLFCLSSDREGWPNVLTEALACGTPVVATRVFGAPEIVKNDSLGILVDRTSEDISGGISRGLEKTWDNRAISAKTSKRTWDRVAEECGQVFDEVIIR